MRDKRLDRRDRLAWLVGAVVLALLTLPARAEIPEQAGQWQREVTRAVQAEHGLSGPVALHGALIHQESRWRPDAESPVGAQGLAQIMPQTAEHIGELVGEPVDPLDPRQAIRAMSAYTAWLHGQIDAADRWAMTLSAYNGGIGWLQRDRAQADDPARWWCSVEGVQTRGDAAQEENRDYVREVMLRYQGRYLRAGWRGPEVRR
ncbi:transglycosylase SLT domain-containing protein [Halorhodospira halophila]|uniref:transglycosylase SLT domain-containing protein n=1 Tax=Halorhodospira halophila TaxID=1053 RepID=UPI001913C2B2|nr:transglycosylase SLT domain-containing protein [Halorhodospira halophila]MBK5942725.1 hypothetical protein [Halorhodospira halophila]